MDFVCKMSDGSPVIVLERFPTIHYAVVYRPNGYQKFVATWYLNENNRENVYWSQGHYFDTLRDCMKYIEGLLK